jgi:hypothetical protein
MPDMCNDVPTKETRDRRERVKEQIKKETGTKQTMTIEQRRELVKDSLHTPPKLHMRREKKEKGNPKNETREI